VERRISAFASVLNGVMIATVGGIATHRAAIIAAANNNHLPAIYPYRYYAADDGLVSYGPDRGETQAEIDAQVKVLIASRQVKETDLFVHWQV
jgi:hypothetical protein